MNQQFLKEQKDRLEKRQKELEERLSSFAKEPETEQGGWSARMPLYDTGGSLEEEADEVEEFSTRLSLGKTLEEELKKVNSALEQIKKGKYGICKKCNKPINQGRLRAYPQADQCAKCH